MTNSDDSGPIGARLSRRDLLRYGGGALGALTLAEILAACGGGGSSSSQSTGASTSSGAASTSSATPKSGGSVKLGINDFFSSDGLDPAQNVSFLGLMTSGMLHDTLIRIDEQWNITPMLAEDWDVNADATEYTFKLRQGVQFHSGKTLDATDVAWSMKHVLDKTVNSSGLSTFEPVLDPAGIVVGDPNTITFKLKAPDAFFLVKMAYWYGRVSEAEADFTKGSAGTGPYKSISFKGGTGFEFERNPNYWQSGQPYVDKITGVVIPDLSTMAQAVLSGDTDFTNAPDFPTIPQFDASNNTEILTSPFGFAYVFGIDGTAKPYSDSNVRKAMKMLVDRQKFVDVVCRGQAVVSADSAVNPADPFYPEGLQPTPYDPEQAAALLKQAGFEGFKETIWTTPLPGLSDGAVLLKNQLEAGKVNAAIKSQAVDEWAKALFVEPLVLNYWARQHPSTMLPFMYQTKGIWNESRLSDPQIDSWILEVQKTVDPAKQKEIYGEILRKYSDTASSIWPFHTKAYFPHKKRLQGLATQPCDLVDFRGAFVTD